MANTHATITIDASQAHEELDKIEQELDRLSRHEVLQLHYKVDEYRTKAHIALSGLIASLFLNILFIAVNAWERFL